jgi:uncharacterized protein with HEPN domain
MRRDGSYLSDIVEACDSVAKFLAGVEKPQFVSDQMRASAVLQKLTVIGEAIARLSPDLKTRYPAIRWSAISAMRNRIVHGYFDIDFELIWTAAIRECPQLRQQVQAILNTDKTVS